MNITADNGPKLFPNVIVHEPDGPYGIGAQLFLDGIKINGLVSYRYENRAGGIKTLILELQVNTVNIQGKE